MAIFDVNTPYTGPRNQKHFRQSLFADRALEMLERNAVATAAVSEGQLIYIGTGDSEAKLARANAAATSIVAALASVDAAAGAVGNFQVAGFLELASWTAATGSAMLSVGARYYLSESTAGRMTTTVPTDSGETTAPVGVAWTTLIFSINIQLTALLP